VLPVPTPVEVPLSCTRYLYAVTTLHDRASCKLICLRATLQAARRSGESWRSLRIEGAQNVTDRALLGCGAKAAQLRELALAGLPGVSVRGLTAFMLCTELTSLELSDLPAFDAAEVTARRQPATLYRLLYRSSPCTPAWLASSMAHPLSLPDQFCCMLWG
jgi:hypothetical protein